MRIHSKAPRATTTSLSIRNLVACSLCGLLLLLAACATTEQAGGEGDLPERIDQYRNDIQALRGNLQSPDDEVRQEAYDRIVELRGELGRMREDLYGTAGQGAGGPYRSQYAEIDRQLSDLEAEGMRARLSASESREDFTTAFEESLRGLDQTMQALERDREQLGGAEADEFDRVFSGLQQRQERLGRWQEQLQSAPEEGFGEMRQGATEELAAYGARLRQARRFLDRQIEETTVREDQPGRR